MSFDRDRLPDALDYFAHEGLKLSARGKWRTANCVFHGGSDSMRINSQTGGWVCMSCGTSGGDVVAYRMAVTGETFTAAAKALGAWVDDGKPAPTRPTPIPPRDAIQLLARECNLIAVAAANVAHGVNLTKEDLERVLQAAGRVNTVAEVFA
ncbi:MAG TPA: CHC2 zinc finger domain-containing protein [Candidatus Saccharibacteria bacterium]|nr:CHC2 zinc finger domain-containing protein [Candidatus Saccharibacteria bacterium]